MAAYIEHAAYKVENLDWYVRFFSEVFEMEVTRQAVASNGSRQVWLMGGVQLCEQPQPCTADGRTDHLCLIVDDLEAARAKALALGCSELPKHHWVMMPDGLRIEMFSALPGAIEALKELPKK